MTAQTETKATETETCTITIAEVGDLYLTGAQIVLQLGITAETTDAELDLIVESEETAASPHQIDGIWRLLRNLREDLRAEAEED